MAAVLILSLEENRTDLCGAFPAERIAHRERVLDSGMEVGIG